jgi:ketosteroid isomerase-like protein
MSEALVRAVFDAYNAHDAEAWAALMTPGGTFESGYWGLDGRTYGVDEFGDYFKQMREQWDDLSMDVDRIEIAGEKAVAVVTLHGTERGTHVAVAPQQALLFEFDAEKVAHIVTIPNVDDALAQLKPI